MRILYIDIDTLCPDHLGCYGYPRNTSPNIDRIAAEGTRFEACYVTDAPCLPSRAALHSGRFGIHNGVVGHGGTAADMRIEGPPRKFACTPERSSWVMRMRQAGLYTCSFSPFAERHASWWFYNGFNEMHNTGKRGAERADEIVPLAVEWLEQRGAQDNWFLHVNTWDPHTPYRTPDDYGNPFEDQPTDGWLTDETRAAHFASYGPHSAQETAGYGDESKWPRAPGKIDSMDAYKKWIDGYDVGIRYADDYVGKLLDTLETLGILDDTAVIVSSDHGENQGELNVYGDHQTADHITSRVPMIVKWPSVAAGRVDTALHYQFDVAATVLELLGVNVPAKWDGVPFADAFRKGEADGRDYLVVSQCAWSCQRAVRRGPWMAIRTYRDGFKDFPRHMLFHLEDDPHETTNLAAERPEVLNECMRLLDEWHGEMMDTSESATDPLWTVMQEGGAFHTRTNLASYCERLRSTGRAHHAEALERRHGKRNWQ